MQIMKRMKLPIGHAGSAARLNFRYTSISAQRSHIDYQFMQHSKLPTLYFQNSLPRLQIPDLKLTCERFLASVLPILDREEYERTVRILDEFKNGDGVELQKLLQRSDKANKHTSYISKPWFDMYLRDRRPLPLNYNPLLIMKHDTRSGYQNQLLRATNLVISSMRFWRSLQADILEPEIYHLNSNKTDTQGFRNLMRLMPRAVATYAAYAFKAFPLDMNQYSRLFGVSRIPGKGKDWLVQDERSKHILVMRRGNMYSVDVLNKDGNIERPNVILGRLHAVLQLDGNSGPSPVPFGALTSSNRDDWATMRQHLIENLEAENKRLLETEIDSALFCLCLDTTDDPVYSEECFVPLLKHLLVGDAKNRWFDKSLSLIVSADGTAALNFEHSWGDGVAVLRYFNEIYKETTESPFADPGLDIENFEHIKSVRPIKLKTDKLVEIAVEKAILNNTYIMKQLNINMLRYPLITKSLCKYHGISPDAIMQLSFQLAYKRAFNDYVGTYESCSTAAFRHGRTETVRPCTMAAKQVCESLMQTRSKQPDTRDLYTSIKRCSQVHNKLVKEAAMGQGFDRHMFALKHQASLHGKRLPEIYNSKGYAKINHNIISTSTLSSNALLAGSFGPVVQDGLGIAYSIQDDYCGVIVSSYEKQRDGQAFVDNLETAFNDIYNILKMSSKKL
ncbi:carnitine O-palmitoyltransferase 2, mitochondrial isoform X2 [Anastrepha ludens]|uniref:carnitine O-palmitoyltransferase 2, mitochondrial isoform X2 n=1 Tax=Anastrepha ludens TaxID=28586 RepID=UPI0023AEA72A|nr:carnitine O-palmitoyltransferase 2, mitochondrial isoform X2 [Anastrepha ludens]